MCEFRKDSKSSEKHRGEAQEESKHPKENKWDESDSSSEYWRKDVTDKRPCAQKYGIVSHPTKVFVCGVPE